jgi:hypothetical protein
MKKASPPATTPLRAFEAGQIWEVAGENVAISFVGKTLVHFRRYTIQARGTAPLLSSKPDFERFLRAKKATLRKG